MLTDLKELREKWEVRRVIVRDIVNCRDESGVKPNAVFDAVLNERTNFVASLTAIIEKLEAENG